MAAGASAFIIVILLPLIIMLGVGVFLIVASRRGRGQAFPACGACGYDLSGSVGSVPRCPECGADFKKVGITPPKGSRSKPMLVAGIVLLILPVTCAGGLLATTMLAAVRQTTAPMPAPLPPTMPASPDPVQVEVLPPTPDDAAEEAEIETTE